MSYFQETPHTGFEDYYLIVPLSFLDSIISVSLTCLHWYYFIML